jgi:hypothetical protein
VASYSALPEPMLARSGRLPTSGDYSYEVKWDGFRAIVSTEGTLRLRSRRGWDMTPHVSFLADLPVKVSRPYARTRAAEEFSQAPALSRATGARVTISVERGGTPRWRPTRASRRTCWTAGRRHRLSRQLRERSVDDEAPDAAELLLTVSPLGRRGCADARTHGVRSRCRRGRPHPASVAQLPQPPVTQGS